MIIDDNIRDEKVQYNVIREVAKISALLSGKIDKSSILQARKYCHAIEV